MSQPRALPLFVEIPSGTVDGFNTVFNTYYKYIAGTVLVSVDKAWYTNAQITENGNRRTVTLNPAPPNGANLRIYYQPDIESF
jgi:transposase